MSAPESEYESFAEWNIRRIPEPSKEPHENYGQRLKTWILSSTGIDGTAKELFLHIEDSKARASSVMQINKKLLESWYSQGKKVCVKSYTSLTVKEDIDSELFDTSIVHLKCLRSLRIPTDVYTRVAHKIRCYGSVDTYSD